MESTFSGFDQGPYKVNLVPGSKVRTTITYIIETDYHTLLVVWHISSPL